MIKGILLTENSAEVISAEERLNVWSIPEYEKKEIRKEINELKELLKAAQ